jgi:hypothetical protein
MSPRAAMQTAYVTEDVTPFSGCNVIIVLLVSRSVVTSPGAISSHGLKSGFLCTATLTGSSTVKKKVKSKAIVATGRGNL